MDKDYTENLLLRYIYGECDILEKLEIEDSLEHDLELHGVFKTMKNAQSSLPKVSFKPKTTSVNNILGYSKACALMGL
ncbi:MAG TPA: hypothetical protein P5235_02980 [Saprospiraceae bacterium]|mgnify:FL=1|nr:hypothetical protein [Saprospiraceae bacterium]